MPGFSVVLPVYNKAEGIPLLFTKLHEALNGQQYEIIAVNDGSKDNTWEKLKKAAKLSPKTKIIDLRRNYGQTAAINAGIQHATGDIIILINSNLENDPADTPNLLAKMNEGYDVVSGWRQNRWRGQFSTRKIPSMMANKLISYISGVHLNDYSCTLKAYKKDVIRDVRLYWYKESELA